MRHNKEDDREDVVDVNNDNIGVIMVDRMNILMTETN